MEELHYAFPSILLAGARIVVLNQLSSYPSLRLLALAINAYGTGALAHKFINFYKNSKKYTWEQMAQICLVQGVNVSSSAYRTYCLFDDCKKTFFSKPAAKTLSKDEAKRKLQEAVDSRQLSSEEASCRLLYFDPACTTLDQKNSSCAPSCKNLTKEQISQQVDGMFQKYRDNGFHNAEFMLRKSH